MSFKSRKSALARDSSVNRSSSHHRRNSSPPAYDDKEIIIAVMGPTGAGKSTFVNLASGSSFVVGKGLQSCTSAVEPSEPFEIFNRKVILIDTPGFDDTTRSDTETLKMIAMYMSKTYEMGIHLSGIIYLHRISDVRMTGISRRNFSMFRKLCGDEKLSNVIIGTTMWSEVSEQRGKEREHELKTTDILFEPVLALGARMVRHDNTYLSAAAILKELVVKEPVPFTIQKQLVDEGRQLEDTDAGGELSREMAEMSRKHRAEIASIRKEMQEALLEKDTELQRVLQEEHQKLTKRIQTLEHDRESMSAQFEEEKRLADRQLKEALAKLDRAQAESKQTQDHSHSQPASKAKESNVLGSVLKVLATGVVCAVAPHLAITAAFT